MVVAVFVHCSVGDWFHCYFRSVFYDQCRYHKDGDNMTTILAHESELKFELGGPAYRLMQRIGPIQGTGPSLGRRAIGFLLITWLLGVLSCARMERACGFPGLF